MGSSRRILSLSAALCLAWVAACDNPSPGGGGSPYLSLELPSAPASAEVAGVEVRLSASVWMNLMPGPPNPSGGPLVVTFRLDPTPAGTFPPGTAVERVWVIGGDHVWNTTPDEVSGDAGGVRAVARGGPEMAQGLPADVAVRLRAPSGKAVDLRVRVPAVEAAH